ncbi:hypothetical protein QR680_004672 [Steinernema hermaphroditum]|uniref:Tyrosine-protein kinase n=1 Tax=Steinernema hermaphroditum TaxID=289476 RepID=A0AA39HRR1_9BILA|nr:hypothetical protein QR680_004672 [Steinernema hermaphroditum]
MWRVLLYFHIAHLSVPWLDLLTAVKKMLKLEECWKKLLTNVVAMTTSQINPSLSGDPHGVPPSDDCKSISDDVRCADYYHGLVPRADIEPLLKVSGDFLLRKTESQGRIVLALSARWETKVKHFMINQNEAHEYYLESHTDKSVKDLIDWHKTTKTPVSCNSGVILRKPVERPPWILNHDAIKFKKKLGEGAFGEVYMADFTTENEGTIQVAVKTMRDEVGREARLKFMKEARLMRKLQHKHIVRILGVAVHEHPLMILMELCPGGSVLSYLRKNKGNTSQTVKLRFALEGAIGLSYLEKQNCIHRDIAARNCLLTDRNEVKISDFGMSDERKQVTDDKLDKVPVKWLAPETMQNKIYSAKSDVWSYGVMVWEIYSEGSEPYPNLTNIQTRAKIVVQNYRMDMPKDTPAGVGKIISQCWSKEPNDRPTFAKIVEGLQILKNK